MEKIKYLGVTINDKTEYPKESKKEKDIFI